MEAEAAIKPSRVDALQFEVHAQEPATVSLAITNGMQVEYDAGDGIKRLAGDLLYIPPGATEFVPVREALDELHRLRSLKEV